MHIPKMWAKAEGEATTPDQRKLPLAAWGWGHDEFAARDEAKSRLSRLIDRVRKGDPFPEKYAYANRPMREEILEVFGDPDAPDAVLTRNRPGAVILNTARLLFLDIDPPAPGFAQKLKRLFSKGAGGDGALNALREALRRHGRGTFRLYRTAAGLRAIAVDREFEPGGADAEALMAATGTDPAYVKLCKVQKSFRARLTPKPWRAGCPAPLGEHPREDAQSRARFATWLAQYESASAKFATCRYLETVGSAGEADFARPLVEVHDRLSCAGEGARPLA